MIRIDSLWLAVGPMDMRAGSERLLARVVQVFGSAQAHHGYLFANARATRIKLLVHDGFVRISAIVDACFRLIMDGVSASSWTRRDARKRGLNVAQTPRLTAAKCDREALGFDFGLLSWGSLSIGPCQAAGGPPLSVTA